MENNFRNALLKLFDFDDDTNYEVLDFTNDSDVEKALKELEEVQETLRKNDYYDGFCAPFFKAISQYLSEECDELKKKIKEENEQSKKGCVPTTASNATSTLPVPVSVPNGPDHRPHECVAPIMQQKFYDLVDDYITHEVAPYCDGTNIGKDELMGAREGLFEFACWLYKK